MSTTITCSRCGKPEELRVPLRTRTFATADGPEYLCLNCVVSISCFICGRQYFVPKDPAMPPSVACRHCMAVALEEDEVNLRSAADVASAVYLRVLPEEVDNAYARFVYLVTLQHAAERMLGELRATLSAHEEEAFEYRLRDSLLSAGSVALARLERPT